MEAQLHAYFFTERRRYKGLQLIRKGPFHAVTAYIQAIVKLIMNFKNGPIELAALLDQHQTKKKEILNARKGLRQMVS